MLSLRSIPLYLRHGGGPLAALRVTQPRGSPVYKNSLGMRYTTCGKCAKLSCISASENS